MNLNLSFLDPKFKRARVGNVFQGEVAVMAEFALNPDAVRFAAWMSTAHKDHEWVVIDTLDKRRTFKGGLEVRT